jgi:hypothetical protein
MALYVIFPAVAALRGHPRTPIPRMAPLSDGKLRDEYGTDVMSKVARCR